MAVEWLKRWNERYAAKEYAYGTDPNVFLKEQLAHLNPGTILLGADGEGRNGVYAATQGWQVSCFDISIEGKNKAQQLAKANNVTIDYQVGILPELGFQESQFDAIALIYAHFPPEIRSGYHQLLSGYLKKGGTIILEAFGKNHLEYRAKNEKIGGPADQETLITLADIQADFPNYEVELLEEKVIELQEGLYHNGVGSVTRFVGRKPK